MHHTLVSSGIVNLDSSANDLTRRLGSLRYFLDAAHELLTISQIPISDFCRHDEQIITLMEIARTTLMRAGVKLYLFTSCPAALIPYKSVYYELLTLLRHNIHCIQPNLRGRLSRLLFALSTRFVIVRKGDSPHLNWAVGSDAWSQWRTAPSPTTRHRFLVSSSTAHEPARYASLMPPPDAFPPGRHELSIDPSSRGRSSRKSSRSPGRSALARTARPPSPRRQSQPSPRASSPTENTPPPRTGRVPGPPRQRRSFGIFCTGNKSVLSRPTERRERAMAGR